MAMYLFAAVIIITVAFLWFGDYGDCKPDGSSFSYYYRIWAVFLVILLVLYLQSNGYRDKDWVFASWESKLFLCFAPFIWCVLTSLISNFYAIIMIEVVCLICSFQGVGKSIHGIDFPALFLSIAGVGVLYPIITVLATMPEKLHILSKNQSNVSVGRF